MLSKRRATQETRLCSICDGVDAVMLFAAWFSRIPPGAVRTDLSMSEALDHLQLHREDRFDTVVLVPNASKTALPRLLQALVEEAGRHTGEVLVLLPLKSRLQIPDAARKGFKVLYGPPFTDTAPPAGEDASPDRTAGPGSDSAADPAPASGFWGRFLPRKGKNRISVPAPSVPIVPPPGRDLPDALKTIMVLPICGGAGATTIAVNLAAELAQAQQDRTVCLIDLHLQYGNVATYAGLTANSRILDAYRGIEALDSDAFDMCLRSTAPNLHIFSDPGEILPVDGINAAHLRRLIGLARNKADVVIVDLPHQLPDWSGAAFDQASVILAPALLDVRSAQNLAKLQDLIRSEGLPGGKFRCLLNRAPLRRSQLWEDARARFEKDNEFGVFKTLPDGGDPVSMACNAGIPLARHAPANVFRLAVRDLAADILAKAGPRELTTAEAG